MSVSAQPSVANLEALLFKATNPSNKIEDVNTIKRFCDAVIQAQPEGAAVACRLIAHKIQSPQEREALQALAVLEACVKACGDDFHVEVGKFKFLNEMIKLVSPKYLGSRTPEHIKRKVIELLYLWSRELSGQSKIGEAYAMLKSQGLVRQDPDYVGSAVFASSLPPRRHESPLSAEQTNQLKLLLQSKNTEDLQRANKIIKGIMKEDERRFDNLSRRSTELTTANNNARLLNEMLDHYDRTSSGQEEVELLKELYEACEKMQPKIYRLAADTEDGDEFIGEILQTSDKVSTAMDRYKVVVKLGQADSFRNHASAASAAATTTTASTPKRPPQDPLEQLLDLGQGQEHSSSSSTVEQPPPPREAETQSATTLEQPSGNDEDLLGLMTHLKTGDNAATDNSSSSNLFNGATADASHVISAPQAQRPSELNGTSQQSTSQQQPPLSVDDLLTNGSPVSETASAALINTILSSSSGSAKPGGALQVKMEDAKASRRRGLDALDMLGESAIKTHLSGTARSPQFEARRNEKMPIAMLQEKQRQEQQQALAQALHPLLTTSEVKQPSTLSTTRPPGIPVQVKSAGEPTSASQKSEPSDTKHNNEALQHSITDTPSISNVPTTSSKDTAGSATKPTAPEVKLADLNVPLSSIKPGSIPPLTILGDGDDASMSIVLHFGRDKPREHVTAVVITMINKTPEPLSDFELRCAVEPRSCRVKLQPPSGNQLPAHNPFVPPAAVTQVMLVSNPKEEKAVSLKYVISYRTSDGETQTDMGEVKELPI